MQTFAATEFNGHAIASKVTTLLLNVRGGNGRDVNLPSVEQTVSVAEVIHRALVAVAARGAQIDCPELTGQAAFGQPLVGPHRHLHVLPVDLDGNGRIDHVVLFAPMGMSEITQRAVTSLKMLYGNSGRPWLRLQPTRSRSLIRYLRLCESSVEQPELAVESLTGWPIDAPEAVLPGSLGTTWQSITPFVPPRYLKKSGKNSLEGQVLAELASRELPRASVTVLETESFTLRHFQRRRSPRHAQPPQDVGFALRLQFASPVGGPICLGYAGHFGLGLFGCMDCGE